MADRRYLIVINQEVIRTLPGVNIVPLSGARAFLALDVDRGMSDLELAVIDRLRHATLERRERQALTTLRTHLGGWRGDARLQIHTRAILVVERLGKKARDGATPRAKRSRRVFASTWALPAAVAGVGAMPRPGRQTRASHPVAARSGRTSLDVIGPSSRDTGSRPVSDHQRTPDDFCSRRWTTSPRHDQLRFGRQRVGRCGLHTAQNAPGCGTTALPCAWNTTRHLRSSRRLQGTTGRMPTGGRILPACPNGSTTLNGSKTSIRIIITVRDHVALSLWQHRRSQ